MRLKYNDPDAGCTNISTLVLVPDRKSIVTWVTPFNQTGSGKTKNCSTTAHQNTSEPRHSLPSLQVADCAGTFRTRLHFSLILGPTRTSMTGLREYMLESLISIKGNFECPAHSSDLAPWDFYLRFFFKSRFYANRSRTLKGLYTIEIDLFSVSTMWTSPA